MEKPSTGWFIVTPVITDLISETAEVTLIMCFKGRTLAPHGGEE